MTGFDSKRDAAADKVQEVRGFLASQLKCWHRLTGKESDELVALFEAQPAQEPVECLDCGSHNVGIPATYDSLINSVKALNT